MTTFESSLRTAIIASPTPYHHARRIIDILDSPPSRRRDRLVARMRNRTTVYLNLNQEESAIDWSTIQWALVILDVVKLLLTIITLFGETDMGSVTVDHPAMSACPPEHCESMKAALAQHPEAMQGNVLNILQTIIAAVQALAIKFPWGQIPTLIAAIVAAVQDPVGGIMPLVALLAKIFSGQLS